MTGELFTHVTMEDTCDPPQLLLLYHLIFMEGIFILLLLIIIFGPTYFLLQVIN